MKHSIMSADFYRLFCKKWFFLCTLFMIGLSLVFIIMQHTAMDYVVGIDRVIFLPMSFYGIAVAALICMFIGEDFGDGPVRIKIVAGNPRNRIYMSLLLVSWAGCLTIYLLTLLTTLGIGSQLFAINVSTAKIIGYVLLGVLSCLAYGSIFCMLAILIGDRNTATITCTILAFGMLFLCLHTNQVLVQEPIKDGLPNLAYVSGPKRVLYEVIHDLNPSGQAAQLSSMDCLNVLRFILCDVFWIILAVFVGKKCFNRKDIR